MLLAQWCSEILNRSNCAGALHWSDIFVRRELRGAEVNSDCVRKKSLVNYLLKVRNVERVEQEASEIIRKQESKGKLRSGNMFYKFIGGANSFHELTGQCALIFRWD